MSSLKYDIVEKIAVLSTRGEWTKELNRISWNDRPAKYDIRDWNHEEGRMGKGTTLSDEEAMELFQALKDYLK